MPARTVTEIVFGSLVHVLLDIVVVSHLRDTKLTIDISDAAPANHHILPLWYAIQPLRALVYHWEMRAGLWMGEVDIRHPMWFFSMC